MSATAPQSEPVTGTMERTYAFDPRSIDLRWFRELPGIEVLRRIAAGQLPNMAIGSTLGFRFGTVEEGFVTVEATPEPFALNLLGTIHGGWAAAVLDTVLGSAVCSVLPPGRIWTTTELSIRYVRAMTAETGPVRAEGRIVHAGRRLATAEGRLVGAADGRLYAHGATSCMVLDVDAGSR